MPRGSVAFRHKNRGFLGWGRHDPNALPPDPRRGAIIGLAITVLLVLGGLYLVHALHDTDQIQDCVMSGRTNCAPIYPR